MVDAQGGLQLNQLKSGIAAEIIGLDLSVPVGGDVVDWIETAFARFPVLVFRDQDITDAQQIAFSERFGELETTKAGTAGAGSKLVVLSNIGENGEIVAPTDKQVLNNRANRHWHADSSFKAIPARASMLSGRVIPPSGGNTEYLSMRAAWASLPDQMKQKVEGLVAIHDYAHGRSKIAPDLVTEEERAAVPPVRQAIVLDHGEHGKSLYLGAHCASVEGMDEAEGRALIDALMAHADRPEHVYSHRWQPHDLILWNNRAVLHRATPFDSADHPRRMVRTTIAGTAPTV